MGKRPGTVERAVIASVRAASWVDADEVDKASVWVLRTVAEALDVGRRRQLSLGEPIPPRDVSELAGRSIQLLRELGLTPTARYRLGLHDPDTESTLAEVLRISAGRD